VEAGVEWVPSLGGKKEIPAQSREALDYSVAQNARRSSPVLCGLSSRFSGGRTSVHIYLQPSHFFEIASKTTRRGERDVNSNCEIPHFGRIGNRVL
jgi:hypothetical protein